MPRHPLAASAAGLLSLMLGLCTQAAPFTPAHDEDLVQALPSLLGSPAERAAARAQRDALRQQPGNLSLALAQARAALDRARLLGDPRELGQAQAALAPWWHDAAPPPAVRLLRATVRQSQHDFAAALQDLDALTTPASATALPAPLLAQAELTRAAVLQVRGELDAARAACTSLTQPRLLAAGPAVRPLAAACQAELDSLQGQPAAAARQLAALQGAPGVDGPWLALLRAELAEREGQPAADALFRAATIGQPGVYALAARADWLLSQGREREVLQLLAGREDADALLLRLAIARHRLHDPAASSDIAQLQARFDAAAARGDRSHAREQSRFALELQGDSAAALRLAQANWTMQKEPADALTLLRAADAAGQPGAAEPALAWARQQGLRDARWPARLLARTTPGRTPPGRPPLAHATQIATPTGSNS